MTRHVLKKIGLWMGALLVIGFHLAPIVWQFITSLKYDRDIASIPPLLPPQVTWDHYTNVLASEFYRFIINSGVVALGSTLLCLLVGSMAAYAITRLPVKGAGLILVLFLATSMFPQIAVISPLYSIINDLKLYNTHMGIIVSHTLIGLPLSVLLLSGFFRGLPREMEEAASVDGSGIFRTYWQIALPLVMPGLVTAGLLVFIASWNEFLFALTFTNSISAQTIPVGIALFPQNFYVPWGDMAAVSLIVIMPLILLVAIFENKLTKGLTGGAIKG